MIRLVVIIIVFGLTRRRVKLERPAQLLSMAAQKNTIIDGLSYITVAVVYVKRSLNT